MNVKDVNQEAVGFLLDILGDNEDKRLPLSSAREKMEEFLGGEYEDKAQETIEYALDNWMVEKILDYNDEEPSGRRVWFLRLLTQEESLQRESLPEEDQAFLKILYTSEGDGQLGAIRSDIATKKLQELRFDPEYSCYIHGLTYDFFTTEDGEQVMYHYLIPEDEKTEEYKSMLEELDEKEERKLRRIEKMQDEK